LRLNNKNINTEKQFKDNFNFKEVWDKLEIVVSDLKEIVFWDNAKKVKLLISINERIKELDCCNSPGDVFADGIDLDYLNQEFGFSKYKGYGDILRNLYNEMFKIKSWPQNKIENTFYIVLAMHCLADKEIREVDEILETIRSKEDGSEIEGILKKPSIELVNSDRPYKIPCFDFKADKDFKIVSKRINNISDSKYGSAKIHIVGEDDKVIETFELKPKESMYINTINNQFLQAIPSIGISNSHIIYKCKSKTFKDTVRRYNFLSSTEHLFDSTNLEGMTQFALDDENGFIAIVKDELELYTNNRFNELFYISEKPVWVCVQGTQYIILTNKGEIITNFAPVKAWKNIIAIYFRDNAALGVTIDGSIISSRNDLQLNKWGKLIFISASEKVSIGMNTRGELHFAGCEIDTTLKGRFFPFSEGYIVLKDDGKVVAASYNSKEEPTAILVNIKEIAVSNSGIAAKDVNDEFMFYNFSDKSIRKLK
jgi:hypothetical protein